MIRALVLALLVACNRPPPEPEPLPPPPPAVAPSPDALALLAKFECNRCHEVPTVAAALPDKQCVGCHQQIHAGTFDARKESLVKWREHITSLREAPSLVYASRLRRDWVVGYLLFPHDVRPGSIAQMPRLPITEHEAKVIATALVPDDESRAFTLDATRGEELFRRYACARCHRFTGARVDDKAIHAAGAKQAAPLDAAWRLAPDLQQTRDRMTPARVVEWIARPRGAMPDLGVSEQDARALGAYISTIGLAQSWRTFTRLDTHADNLYRSLLARVPVLAREVKWDEVERAVFRDTCWHCHSSPDFARGDGGPGNSGGFGFAPRGLDLSSYSAISSGSLDDRGERRSVFAPREGSGDDTPRLVARLIARHVEETGYAVAGVFGMPLGLPALPFEKIQLVATWIAQGRPN